MPLDQKDLNYILTQASVKLTGASMQAIKAELYQVLDEFFDISSSWLEMYPLDAQAFKQIYQITPAEGGKIIRLGGVMASTNFATNALLQAAIALNNGAQAGMVPVAATMGTLGQLCILLPPTQPQAMAVLLIKNVDATETNEKMIPLAPDWSLGVFGRYILDGIIGKMAGTANKSYTNDTLSAYHLRRFQEGISRARVAALKKNTYGQQAWAYPANFRTRGQRGYLSVGAGNDRSFG